MYIIEFILDKYCINTKELGNTIVFTSLAYSLFLKDYELFVELIILFIKYNYTK